MTLDRMIADQLSWANRRWPGHTSKRAPTLELNLICEFDIESRKEFESGSGGELGRNGNSGNMSSLRSSSAVAYNVFRPWRGLDLQPFNHALQASIRTRAVRFEQKFRHGLSSTPPNIDVVIDCDEPQPLGVECKFTEPYGNKADHPPLDPKYFAAGRSRWTEAGLPICQELARSIGSATSFRRLGAGQLVKHLLGLAHTTNRPPRLRYLWFDTGCLEAAEHRIEINRFAELIDGEVEFNALTYQELLISLREYGDPIPGYGEYLADRYLNSTLSR